MWDFQIFATKIPVRVLGTPSALVNYLHKAYEPPLRDSINIPVITIREEQLRR
jgi:hypothetical protein